MKTRLFLGMQATLYDYDTLKDELCKNIEGTFQKQEKLHLTLTFFGDIYSQYEIIADI